MKKGTYLEASRDLILQGPDKDSLLGDWKTQPYEELVADVIEGRRQEVTGRQKKKLAEKKLIARLRSDNPTSIQAFGLDVYLDHAIKAQYDQEELALMLDEVSADSITRELIPRLKTADLNALKKKYPSLESIIADANMEFEGKVRVVISDGGAPPAQDDPLIQHIRDWDKKLKRDGITATIAYVGESATIGDKTQTNPSLS